MGCGPQEEFYNCADVAIHQNKGRKRSKPVAKAKVKSEAYMPKDKPTRGNEVHAKKDTATSFPIINPYLKALLETYKAKDKSDVSLGKWAKYQNSMLAKGKERAKALLSKENPSHHKGFGFSGHRDLNQTRKTPTGDKYYDRSHNFESLQPKYDINGKLNAISEVRKPKRNSFRQLIDQPASRERNREQIVYPSQSSGHYYTGTMEQRHTRLGKYHNLETHREPTRGYQIDYISRGQGQPNRLMGNSISKPTPYSKLLQMRRERLINHWKQLRVRQLNALRKSVKSAAYPTGVPRSYTSLFYTSKPDKSKSVDQHDNRDNGIVAKKSSESKHATKSSHKDHRESQQSKRNGDKVKTYVHKLPHWLITALRLKADENRKLSHNPKSSQIQHQIPISKQTYPPPQIHVTYTQAVQDLYDRQEHMSLKNSQKQRNIRLHNEDTVSLRNRGSTPFDRESFINSSEEESLIQKIVQLILGRNKLRKAVKSKEEKTGRIMGSDHRGDKGKEASSKIHYKRLSNIRSVPYTSKSRIPSPTPYTETRVDMIKPSPKYPIDAYSSDTKGYQNPSHKLPNFYYSSPNKHGSYSNGMQFIDPKVQWVYQRDSRNNFRDQYQRYLNEPDHLGPETVPYANIESLDKRKNYLSVDNAYSNSYSNSISNQLSNRQMSLSDGQISRQSPYQQQQNYMNNYVQQNPNFLWTYKMQNKDEGPIHEKKSVLICTGLVTLGGGMDRWCSDNCNANFCPTSMCTCKMEPPEPMPVIAPFTSNRAGILSHINGVTWLPFSRQNSLLAQAKERGSSPYFPKTSAYNNDVNRGQENQRLENVGFKYGSIRNEHVQRFQRSPNLVHYYDQTARSVPSLLRFPYSSNNGYVDRQREPTYYEPRPTSNSRIYPINDFFLQNKIYYRKSRDSLSPFSPESSRPY